jgi:hypothetical protein
MSRFLNSLSYPLLVIASFLLGLAPFVPEPHLVEKLRMLANGQLHRPLDIFDLLFHATPLGLLALKLVFEQRRAP